MGKRVFLIVLDSFGIGYEPDAADFGDVGANTLGSIRASEHFRVPNLEKLGLLQIDGVEPASEAKESRRHEGEGWRPWTGIGTYCRLQERSRGKDTTVGHWELAGVVSKKPLPTYPNGFPQEVIAEFEKRTGRGTLCNLPYSGTEVIREYGMEHLRTGKLIVYTSADSVFQIAAHEELVPREQLYEYCRMARELLKGEHGVGRVIARPFVGKTPETFQRTSGRHDFSLEPPEETMLDALQRAGYASIGIGKIRDIFAGRGLDAMGTEPTVSNRDGMAKTLALLSQDFSGLVFTNLVETDMIYGHRRDIDGYAAAISEFDRWLEDFLPAMRPEDILMITADHGCDPGFRGTDHTREYVPLLIYGDRIRRNQNLHTRSSFADVSATILELFGIPKTTEGTSFLGELLKDNG